MSLPELIATAERALPLMSDSAQREVAAIIVGLKRTQNAAPESLADLKERARLAFEKDMQPVVTALASALHTNDLAALKGLQALLPGMLHEVNRAPALADLLALQLGTAFLEGLGENAEKLKAETRK